VAIDIRAHPAPAELAGWNEALVLASKALEITVGEPLDERRVDQRRHAKL
jgi:hypothetical protein